MKTAELFRHGIINLKTLFYKIINKLKTPEVWLYLFFGVLTTGVDWCITFVGYRVFDEFIEANNLFIHAIDVVAWIAAVLFAFFTNRGIVFKSERKGAKAIITELSAFSGGRVITLLLQELIIFIFFTTMGINKYIVKIAAAVIVVILNYFISLVIFKTKQIISRNQGKDED